MFSPWHSYRLFRQYTGCTPSEYLRRLRLSKSALELKRGALRVTDAAYALGFGSVDGYQRAFRRNSAAIRGPTPESQCRFRCSSPTA